jgi:PilZ domain-containing protein
MVEFSADFPFKRRSTDRVSSAPPPDNQAPVPNSKPAPATPETIAASIEPTTPPQPSIPALPQKKPFVERRKYMRERMSVPGLIHVDTAKGPPIKVTLVDISIAGARFATAQPLDIGDKLQIRVEAGPFRWTTRMRVVHCTRPDEGLTIIGCAFLRTELLRPWPVAA